MFAQLQTLNVDSISTSALTSCFGWKDDEAFQQHDVSELNRILLDAIELSLKGTKQESLVCDLYKGTSVQTITCSVCKYTSERKDEFLDISLAVEGKSSLIESLDQFLAPEYFSEDNKYFCNSCSDKVDAEKKLAITSLPPILTFSLSRFRFDWNKGVREKIYDRFDFPGTLDLRSYCEGSSSNYELCSVVIHRGSARGGHYFAYIRDFLHQGVWSEAAAKAVKVEDTSSSSASLKLDPEKEPLSIFLALFASVGPGTTLSVEDLATRFTVVAGVSWAKGFKKEYGQLVVFLRRCSDYFSVTKNHVALRTPPKKDELKSRLPVESKSAESSSIFEGNWFEFNDELVTPIQPSKIPKQFGSRHSRSDECAYMLVYRRKHEESQESIEVPPFIQRFFDIQNLAQVEKARNEAIKAGAISVFISVLRSDDLRITKQICLVSSRVLTLLSLKESISTILDIPVEHQLLNIFEDYSIRELSPDKNSSSLSSLYVLDDSEIFLEDSRSLPLSGSMASSIAVSRRGQIQVKVKFISASNDSQKFSLFLDPKKSIGQLKKAVSLVFQLILKETVRKFTMSCVS